MSRYRTIRVVLAGAVAAAGAGALAGCGSSASTTAATTASTPAAAVSGPAATASATAATADGTPAAAGSAPFPVAVGNTWVYQDVNSVNNAHALVTRRVTSVSPVAGGRRVTMSRTAGPGSSASTTAENYLFYADGRIGYPVSEKNGVSVVSSTGVIWPDAADLASGRAFRSRLLVRLGTGQYETADVAVQGGGTASVTVPAGTYRATVVTMTMTMLVGSFTSTAVVKVWTAAGTGPVKSVELTKASGKTSVTSTEELLTFTRG